MKIGNLIQLKDEAGDVPHDGDGRVYLILGIEGERGILPPGYKLLDASPGSKADCHISVKSCYYVESWYEVIQ